MNETRDAGSADPQVGRYQIVAVGKNEAVLLDTATGSSWSLARDVDTLQLGWRPLEERWPENAPHHAPDPSQALLETRGAERSAAWWTPRFDKSLYKGRVRTRAPGL